MAGFTTIAAGIGLATSAASTAGSFVQAAKQRERQKQAEIDAQEAMDAAKAKLEVNYMEGRSIQKEAYERAREAGITGAAQIVQAAREGEQRGASVGAGRAAVFNEAAQAQARTDMAQDLQNLETAALKEESRLRDARANLDLAEVAGQQQIAADARAAEQAANMAAVGGLVNLGTQAMKLPSLYGSAQSQVAQGTPLPGGTLPDVDTSIQGMVNTVQPQYNRSFGDPFPSIFDRNFQTPQIAFPGSIDIPSISAGGQFSNFQ